MGKPSPEAFRRVERERTPSERVVITGFAQRTPLGGTQETWEGLLQGRSGVQKLDVGNFRTNIAAPLTDFDPDEYLTIPQKRRLPQLTKLLIPTTQEAAGMAGILDEDGKILSVMNKRRVGVCVSSGIGTALNLIGVDRTIHKRDEDGNENPAENSKKIGAIKGLQVFPEEVNAEIAMDLGCSGWALNSAEACATSLSQIVEAARLVREGYADCVIAGGAEEVLYDHPEVAIGLFAGMRALSTRNEEPERASRPFDIDRDGFVLASGGGVVVVEREDTARARGAEIYAQILGFEKSIDGKDAVKLDIDRVAQTVTQALYNKKSGEFYDVDAIFAHATSTDIGDVNEAEVLRTVFGEELGNIPITAVKSMLGHMAGGAGVANVVAALCAMRDGKIPHIANLENPDEAFSDLFLVKDRYLEQEVNNPLVLAYGFGGHNAVLLLGKYQ